MVRHISKVVLLRRDTSELLVIDIRAATAIAVPLPSEYGLVILTRTRSTLLLPFVHHELELRQVHENCRDLHWSFRHLHELLPCYRIKLLRFDLVERLFIAVLLDLGLFILCVHVLHYRLLLDHDLRNLGIPVLRRVEVDGRHVCEI